MCEINKIYAAAVAASKFIGFKSKSKDISDNWYGMGESAQNNVFYTRASNNTDKKEWTNKRI